MNPLSSGLSSISSLGDRLTSPARETSSTGGFGDVLKGAIEQVDQLHLSADQKVGSMLQGSSGAGDVSGVMVAVEKADVAFQLMMQVRNKIVNAYQDIEKMQF